MGSYHLAGRSCLCDLCHYKDHFLPAQEISLWRSGVRKFVLSPQCDKMAVRLSRLHVIPVLVIHYLYITISTWILLALRA